MIPGNEETTSRDIPLDVVEKILLKLPAKSIIRSRGVCKAWGDLSKGSRFAALHSKETGYDCVVDILCKQNCPRDSGAHETCEKCSPEVVLYSKTLNSENGQVISNHQLLSNHALESTPSLFKLLERKFKAVGNCNGIVCITDFVHIFLINPSLNEMKKITPPQMDASRWWSLIGLGLDEFSDNFKVVTVTSYWNKRADRVTHQRGLVYNLSSNSWSIVGKIPCSKVVSRIDGTSVFVNGVIHWCVYTGFGNYCIKVLTFNTTTELFQLLNLPEGERERCSYKPRLLVLNQKLLAFASTGYDINKHVNIWVMKDYGVEESWTKLYSIRPPSYVRDPIEPVSYWEEDKIFLRTNNGNLVLYDMLQGRSSGSIDLSGNGLSCHHFSMGCSVYKESLISVSSIF